MISIPPEEAQSTPVSKRARMSGERVVPSITLKPSGLNWVSKYPPFTPAMKFSRPITSARFSDPLGLSIRCRTADLIEMSATSIVALSAEFCTMTCRYSTPATVEGSRLVDTTCQFAVAIGGRMNHAKTSAPVRIWPRKVLSRIVGRFSEAPFLESAADTAALQALRANRRKRSLSLGAVFLK